MGKKTCEVCKATTYKAVCEVGWSSWRVGGKGKFRSFCDKHQKESKKALREEMWEE